MSRMTNFASRVRIELQPDFDEIQSALSWLYDEGDVVEKRVLFKNDRGYDEVTSGYYDNRTALARNAYNDSLGGRNVYVTLNPAAQSLLARRVNHDESRPANTTKDGEIRKRTRLLVDVDPVRPAGISATEEEHAAALVKAEHISRVMQEEYSWPEPVIADSGNGAHLLYYIDLPNNNGATSLIQRVLEQLASRFDDESVKVDKSVFNAARIVKLYGCVARKGDHLPERPHRVSSVLALPSEWEVLTVDLMLRFASGVSDPASPVSAAGASHVDGAFDISEWIDTHGVIVQSHGPYTNVNGATYRWQLEACPLCGESDHSAVILLMRDGKPAFRCHHNRCDGKGWRDYRAAIDPAYAARRATGGDLSSEGDDDVADLPEVFLPGGGQSISKAAREFGILLEKEQTHFVRGGTVVKVTDYRICPVVPAAFASDLEQVASLVRLPKGKGKSTKASATCAKSAAELLLNAKTLREALPEIQVLSRCPILVERDNGELAAVAGYDAESGVHAAGPLPPTMELEVAAELLNGLLQDFHFVDGGDRARALAALLTPGMLFGGLLGGRAPLTALEADQSQTGKGYFHRLTAAIYLDKPFAVAKSRGGVGSLEEMFDGALIAGRTFISLDNVRGRINSPKLESFLTEELYSARCAYQPNTEIDPKRVYLMLTSNQAEMTTDLVNRSSCIRLLKQPAGYQFKAYPEGDLLDHVRANQPQYLGAVSAVIRAWHEAGKQRSNETRHAFRAWSQTLDWIVQHLLGAAPLMDGHRETQQRMANPALTWLRSLALAVAKQGRTGVWLLTSHLLDIAVNAGDIEIPGMPEGADPADEQVRESALRQIGRRLSQCFSDKSRQTLDGYLIERDDYTDDSSRPRHQYRVSEQRSADAPAMPSSTSQGGLAHPAVGESALVVGGPEIPNGYEDAGALPDQRQQQDKWYDPTDDLRYQLREEEEHVCYGPSCDYDPWSEAQVWRDSYDPGREYDPTNDLPDPWHDWREEYDYGAPDPAGAADEPDDYYDDPYEPPDPDDESSGTDGGEFGEDDYEGADVHVP